MHPLLQHASQRVTIVLSRVTRHLVIFQVLINDVDSVSHQVLDKVDCALATAALARHRRFPAGDEVVKILRALIALARTDLAASAPALLYWVLPFFGLLNELVQSAISEQVHILMIQSQNLTLLVSVKHLVKRAGWWAAHMFHRFFPIQL